jgi:nucleotide-binding universal stress UspA family protein
MKVVVGYDGSDHAMRALERAADLVGTDGQVVVVSSAEPRVTPAITGGGHLDPSEFAQRQQAVEEARSFLSERGIDTEVREAYGDPGSAIIEAGADADLVVVGSRGLNRVERLLLGSVSTKVVQRAPGDVLVVR